jgi:hypothetical protein
MLKYSCNLPAGTIELMNELSCSSSFVPLGQSPFHFPIVHPVIFLAPAGTSQLVSVVRFRSTPRDGAALTTHPKRADSVRVAGDGGDAEEPARFLHQGA